MQKTYTLHYTLASGINLTQFNPSAFVFSVKKIRV
uniref:Uncharacterized protein n=1 Tax=Tetranychus urticae TaxID=32264 RepID=T1L2I5_TETUR